MFPSIFVQRRSEISGIPRGVVVGERRGMRSCGCESIELDFVFFRIGVRHNMPCDGGRFSRSWAGIALRWPPPPVFDPLLCQFIGLLAKRLYLSAKFHQFGRSILRSRAALRTGEQA